MKFSEQWLREWVNPAVSTEELCAQLTMAGLEVDAVEPVAGTFSGVVVGEIIVAEPHPDADKLQVCQVEVGQDEPLNIVCGAANARVGIRVPAALVGAVLPGDFKIKKAKLRGVPSFGMLCSAKELGLAESAEGLLELPADAPVGNDIRDYLGLNDVSIELGLTPNRGDCLSVAGVAREVGVLNRCSVQEPAVDATSPGCDATFPVELRSDDCPRYAGRVIQGVNPKAETPLWMQERLRRSGIRCLGPVVDITNYVLLELGQPMHAFDLDTVSDGIVVRRAEPGEKLMLLNDVEIALEGDALVIADSRGPLALAGVMGGAASAVGDDTRNIFLESAFFLPDAIAGRARRYGLHTDSSHRFERGVSPALQVEALERATALLLEIAGGVAGPMVEAIRTEQLSNRAEVTLRHARIARVLGMAIPAGDVNEILTRLGMTVSECEGGWTVMAPAYRFDIAIEEDLIEEVGRIYGYSNLPTAEPQVGLTMYPRPEAVTETERLRLVMVDRGYHEAITYSFVDPNVQAKLDPEHAGIVLANPISADLSVMRTTLWAGLIPAAVHNLNRQQDRVRLFETGLRFVPQEGGLLQEPMLAGVAVGACEPEQWGAARRAVDFYDVKGDVEALLALLGDGQVVDFIADVHPALHPGQTARIQVNGEHVGWVGAVHPSLERPLELSGRTFVFELRLAPFNAGSVPEFRELSKFPAIRRDIAVIVDRAVNAAAVRECIRGAAPSTLKNLQLFDVYTGEGIDSGRKSLALGLTLQEHSRTLTDSEVDAAVADVVAALKEQLGATLRD